MHIQTDLGDERFFDQGGDDCALPDALYNGRNWSKMML